MAFWQTLCKNAENAIEEQPQLEANVPINSVESSTYSADECLALLFYGYMRKAQRKLRKNKAKKKEFLAQFDDSVCQ